MFTRRQFMAGLAATTALVTVGLPALQKPKAGAFTGYDPAHGSDYAGWALVEWKDGKMHVHKITADEMFIKPVT